MPLNVLYNEPAMSNNIAGNQLYQIKSIFEADTKLFMKFELFHGLIFSVVFICFFRKINSIKKQRFTFIMHDICNFSSYFNDKNSF